MKKYMVIKNYSGAIAYEVEANSEEEADEIATERFENESDKTLVENLELDRITSIEEMED